MLYLIVLIFCFVCIFKYDIKEVSNYKSFWMLFVILSLIAGLRYYIGGDTEGYRNYFYNSPLLEELNASYFSDSRFQPGWLYFQSFIRTVFGKFVYLQLIQALFVTYSVFFFLKKYSPTPYLAVLFFFMMNYFEFDMEIMREAIAIALGLWAYYFYENKKQIIISVLLVFIAIQFHISAVVLLFYPLLKKVGNGSKMFWCSLAFCLALPSLFLAIPNLDFYVTLLFGQQEDWFLDQYLKQSFSDTLNINYYITHTAAYVILPYFIVYLLIKDNRVKINGFIYAYAYFQYLAMFSYGFYRFANYFAPFYWIGLSLAFIIIFKRYYKLNRALFLITFIFLAYMYRGDLLGYEAENQMYLYEKYYPYKTVLLENKPY